MALVEPYVNPRKTKSARFLGNVDISGVRDAILAIPEEVWSQEDSKKPNAGIKTLDQTQHIVFRYVRTFGDWRESIDEPIWADWHERLSPLLLQATAAYGYRNAGFPRIMLARMAPGGIIHPHRDNMPAAKWPHKIHVPILTNPGVQFYLEPETFHFPEGIAVEVNNMDLHAVRNEGTAPRIHLIFEYFDKDQPSWFEGALATR